MNYSRFSEALRGRKEEHLYRTFTPEREELLFATNDYLGLSQHPLVIERAQEALREWGCSSRGARSFSRHLPLHHRLETSIAAYLKREKALLFSSGFQLNSTLLKTLGPHLCFLDQRCHRSLLEGATGKVYRYRHNDPHHLEILMKKHRGEGEEAWIITESLFSMDGDRAPLEDLVRIKHRYGAYLLVDEAHALGVLGLQGQGLAPSETDLVVGAFGKAFGGFGGCVAGPEILIDYLANFCPGFLFTTALPPSVVGGLIAAINLLPTMKEEREKLRDNSRLLRGLLGLPEGDHIVPYPTGSPEKALELSRELRVPAVRPPTVPPKGSILRFSLSSKHTPEEIGSIASQLIKRTGRVVPSTPTK